MRGEYKIKEKDLIKLNKLYEKVLLEEKEKKELKDDSNKHRSDS